MPRQTDNRQYLSVDWVGMYKTSSLRLIPNLTSSLLPEEFFPSQIYIKIRPVSFLSPWPVFLASQNRNEPITAMASVDINKLLEQLESVASSPPQDPKLQQRLYDAAQKLSLAVEAPLDTVYRVIYSVRHTNSFTY